MLRKRWALLGPFLAAGLAAATALAQDNRPAKTTGDKLDDAVKSIKRGAREAGQSIQQEFEHARTSVHNMGISGRIYGRLHWDKNLQTSDVKIDVQEDGVTTLSGTVSDAKAKAKALALTQDTVGVVKVMDRMTIRNEASDTSRTEPKGTRP